jgi:tRNA (adenine22-N1)-methyltransferase
VDVGTDHALLPIYLAASDRVSFAIATDVAKGPCEAATNNVREHGLLNQISVRMGDGLSTVEPGEVDTVTIAGMGGHTARMILEGAPNVVEQLKRIIVQPMNASSQVRQFFYENEFRLVDETVLVEDGRFYEVIVAAKALSTKGQGKGQGAIDPAYETFMEETGWFELALEFGPINLSDPSQTFKMFVQDTMKSWRHISLQMAKSTTEEAQDRMRQLAAKVDKLSQWLQSR